MDLLTRAAKALLCILVMPAVTVLYLAGGLVLIPLFAFAYVQSTAKGTKWDDEMDNLTSRLKP